MNLKSLTLTVLLMVLAFSPFLRAQQPELSYWTKNISEGQGASGLGFYDFAHEIAVSGNTVHCLWIADSAYYYKLFYRRSVDNGNTWGERKLLAKGVYPYFPTPFTSKRMAVDGETVHIVYIEHHTGGMVSDVYYLRSTDGGASFESARPIFDLLTRLTDRIFISCSGDKVSVLVQDWDEQQAGFYFLNSPDAGAGFSTSVFGYQQVDDWSMEDLIRDGDHVYALIYHSDWYNGLVYGYLYFLASHNGGSSFESTTISIPSTTQVHLTYPLQHPDDYSPKIALSGDNIYVVFPANDWDGEYNLLFRRSPDRGNSWSDAFNLTKLQFTGTEIPANGMQTIYAARDYVYILFPTTANRSFAMSSSDYGVTFAFPQELTRPGIPYLALGGFPRGAVDSSDPTGKTFHVILTPPSYTKTDDGGEHYRELAAVGTQFSWYNEYYTKRPKCAAGMDGSFLYALEGRYVYAYDDIFYQRIDTPMMPSSQTALKLRYIYSGNRYDNIAVPSSEDLQFTGGRFTVEAWIKPEVGSEKSAHIISKQDITSYPYSPGAYQLATHGNRQLSAGITTSDGATNIYSQKTIPEGEWTHVAMTYHSLGGTDNFKVYINGLLDVAATVTGVILMGDGNLFIGSPGAYTYGFNGLIDEVRLWSRNLSEQEIQESMYIGLRGEEDDLVAYYSFNNTTRDLTGHGNDGYLMYLEEYVVDPIVAPDTDSDGIPDPEEWGPNGYQVGFDGNNDGLADWKQSNVASFKSYRQQQYITLASISPEREIISLVNVVPKEVPPGQPSGYDFPYDMVEFSLNFPPGSSNAIVSLYAHGSAAFDTYVNYGGLPSSPNPVYYGFRLEEGTGATIEDRIITLHFTDGQRGDHDLLANGTMTTMGGPGKAPEGWNDLAQNSCLRVYPNPVNDLMEIRFDVPVNDHTTLTLYNAQGKQIAVIYEGISLPGGNICRYDAQYLPPGIYYCMIKNSQTNQVVKVLVMR